MPGLLLVSRFGLLNLEPLHHGREPVVAVPARCLRQERGGIDASLPKCALVVRERLRGPASVVALSR
jgi:hypothetical protein